MLKGVIFEWKMYEKGTFSVEPRDGAFPYKTLSHSTPPPPSPRQGEQHARLDLVSHVNCCDQIKCLHSLIAFSHLA